MGNTPQFPLSYEDTVKAIKQYKQDIKNGVYPKADFWHFCGVIGVDAKQVVDVIKKPADKNIKLSGELKKFVTWVQGEYLTAPGWGGPNSSKAIFALKQDLGGLMLTDKQDSQVSGDVKIQVNFGVKDAFK